MDLTFGVIKRCWQVRLSRVDSKDANTARQPNLNLMLSASPVCWHLPRLFCKIRIPWEETRCWVADPGQTGIVLARRVPKAANPDPKVQGVGIFSLCGEEMASLCTIQNTKPGIRRRRSADAQPPSAPAASSIECGCLEGWSLRIQFFLSSRVDIQPSCLPPPYVLEAVSDGCNLHAQASNTWGTAWTAQHVLQRG